MLGNFALSSLPLFNQTNFFMKEHIIILLKVLWSGIGMVDGRGKLGGTVMSKSKQGATARVKVTPVNPRSARQQAIRAAFTSLSQAWRNLTEAQISAWNEASKSGFRITNIFGSQVGQSGNDLYIGLNSNLINVDASTISNPPDPADSPAILSALAPTSDVSSTNLFVKATIDGASTVPAANALIVYATPKLSRGVSFVKSQLRILSVQPAADDTDTVNLWSTYTAKYGAPAVGDNIYLQVQLVNTVSGISGTPIKSKVVISA